MNLYGKLAVGIAVVGTAVELCRRLYKKFNKPADKDPHIASSSWQVSTSPDFNEENIVADTTIAAKQEEIEEATECLGEQR